MIDFYTLAAAANYIPDCLLCKSSMSYRDIDAEVQYEYDRAGRRGQRTHLTFTDSNLSYTDKISICLETEVVERETIQNDHKSLNSGFVTVSSSLHSTPPERGDKYLGLGLECKECHDYNYMIQIVVDLGDLRIKRLTLNSESVAIRSDEGLFEIRNAYTTRETHYYFSRHPAPPGSPNTFTIDKQQKLPLIPLDRKDPSKTLKRIRNLLVFT
jgi:hypothetical protein